METAGSGSTWKASEAAWGILLSAVRTRQPAYHDAFGHGFWDDLDAHPEVAASFDALMGTGHGVPDSDVLLDPVDCVKMQTVVDVGGGTAMLLTQILRVWPHLDGRLVDLPRTVAPSGESLLRPRAWRIP